MNAPTLAGLRDALKELNSIIRKRMDGTVERW